MTEFRHEYKYICTRQQIETIRNSIRGVMQPDRHTEAGGEYVIRSLYFDDYSDSCLRDNINGNDPREKFRIRIYNADLSYIRLDTGQTAQGRRGGRRYLQEILSVAAYQVPEAEGHHRI